MVSFTNVNGAYREAVDLEKYGLLRLYVRIAMSLLVFAKLQKK